MVLTYLYQNTSDHTTDDSHLDCHNGGDLRFHAPITVYRPVSFEISEEYDEASNVHIM